MQVESVAECSRRSILQYSRPLLSYYLSLNKVSKGAKIRYRYNQVPHLTQGTNGKVTNSQLDITNESQEVSPFPAGDHKATINRRAQKHNKHMTETQKKYRLGTVSKNILLEGINRFKGTNLTLSSDVDQDTLMFGLHERLLTYQYIIS